MNQSEFYRAKLMYETDSWDLAEALRNGDGLVIIDARSAEAYAREHIPTAISFPHRSMTAETTAALDKNKAYVNYCDGIGCKASTKGALKLADLGFQVKELLGGLDWWKRDGYPTEGTGEDGAEGISCGC
ncbi:MAG: rhodanese [Desulfuromonas sp.]|nr:MAG: rhodanese [Desulfuromonas sp.]